MMASTANEVWLKTPTEEKVFEFEVPVIDLATGETISAAVITSTPTLNGVTWGACSITGRIIQSKATLGTTGITYHWKMVITTSVPQTLHYCGDLVVDEC